MTYFYAQLFAMDTEIRAMFPAAMDVQRRRFFEGSAGSPLPSRARPTAIASCLTCRNSGPDHMIVKTARVLRERGAPSRLIRYDLDPKASQGL